jgi:hypothetical protein
VNSCGDFEQERCVGSGIQHGGLLSHHGSATLSHHRRPQESVMRCMMECSNS